jgi:5-methylcytosine-specific restriction endonuclease McrBC regulatory subunit McrC
MKPVNHPYFTKYRELQKLCLQILRREKTTFGGKDNEIHGLLFDGSWLWEEYVNTLVSDKYWHPKNKEKIYKQYLFKNEKGEDEGKVYPDFISKAKDSSNRVIMDAKYKRDISGGDYLQLLAYMYRFDSKCGLYIYPDESGKNTDKPYKLLRGVNIEGEEKSCGERSGNENDPQIYIIKIGLGIPQKSETFNLFKKSITENEILITKFFS